jgi:hypothetical protein
MMDGDGEKDWLKLTQRLRDPTHKRHTSAEVQSHYSGWRTSVTLQRSLFELMRVARHKRGSLRSRKPPLYKQRLEELWLELSQTESLHLLYLRCAHRLFLAKQQHFKR